MFQAVVVVEIIVILMVNCKVETKCSSYAPGTETLNLPSSSDFSNTQWTYQTSDFAGLLIDPDSDIVNSSWVSSSLFPIDQPRPSLGAIFATPEIFGAQNASYSLFSCTIDARWAYTQVLLDESSDRRLSLTRIQTQMALSLHHFQVLDLSQLRCLVSRFPTHGLLLLTPHGSTPSPSPCLVTEVFSTQSGRYALIAIQS